jgi:T4-like virus tail tube protein gp19
MGWPVCVWRQQTHGVEAYDGGRRAQIGWRSVHFAQVAGSNEVRGNYLRPRPNYGSALGSEVSLANFRKDIYLEFYNEAGQLVIAYKIYRCWVSEYQAMPDLDANANAIAIEHIKLENEGWERDTSVTEPREPTLTTVNT